MAVAPLPHMSDYPHGWRNGLSVQNVPIVMSNSGNTFWVDSNTGSDGGSGDRDHPFATIDYAVGRCTANNGDLILVYPGHTETITAAGGIDLDVAGISIVGIGAGSLRPTINFTTSTGADLDVDAANITIKNIYFDITGIDAVVGAIDVNAADCTIENCEFLMADAGGQCTECIVTATAASRLKVIGCTFRAPNAGANNALSIEGTPDGIEILNNYIYGDFGDAAIHNPTSNVATNVKICGNYLRNDQTGDHAIELVSAVTGIFADNYLVTDAIATAADLGALVAFNNQYFDSSDTDAAGTPYPLTATTGGVGAPNITYIPQVAVKSTGSMASGFGTADSPVTLFNVTGDCLVKMAASMDVQVTSTGGTGTLEVGVAGNTACLLVQDAADGTAFDVGDSWTLTTGADNNGAQLADEWVLIGNGVDIILTIATNNMTAGDIDFYAHYIPLTSGSSLVAA